MSSVRPPILALLLLALVGCFAWLGTEVARGRTMNFDLSIRQAIHQYAKPRLTEAMIAASVVGSAYLMAPLAAIAFVLLWRGGLRDQARLFAYVMAGAYPLQHALKLAFHRPRPQPFFDYPLPVSQSFPSGHALVAVAFFGALAALLASRRRTWWARLGLWLAAAALIAIIGFSRIYLGVHYPTDVIGGYAAGLIWALTVAFGNHLREARIKRV